MTLGVVFLIMDAMSSQILVFSGSNRRYPTGMLLRACLLNTGAHDCSGESPVGESRIGSDEGIGVRSKCLAAQSTAGRRRIKKVYGISFRRASKLYRHL